MNSVDTVVLYQEFRLIERNESHLNSTWKGAHLLLFFMAFVFGSFCTFNFHMLMYLFDKKCVLFPKLITLSSLPHEIIYEFIPVEKEVIKMLPVDFVSTQWMEKSVCYLPTYVPLMSCIFGMIWTTIFLVCYTGNRALAGSNRPWRVLPPIFVFSVAMSGVCVYSSTITYKGLDELCIKLGEITGSATCSYTVNVATLAYERSIRGVYQAIQLTNFSAWLHTSCWLLSAMLVLVRILLAVDFQLVKVTAELRGDIDMMLEQYEEHMRTVSPVTWPTDEDDRKSPTASHYSHQSQPSTSYEPRDQYEEVSENLNRELREFESYLVPGDDKIFTLSEPLVIKDEVYFRRLLYEILDEICPETELDSVPLSIAFNLSPQESILSRPFRLSSLNSRSTRASVDYWSAKSSEQDFFFDREGNPITKAQKEELLAEEIRARMSQEPEASTSKDTESSKANKPALKHKRDDSQKSDKVTKVHIQTLSSEESSTSSEDEVDLIKKEKAD